MPRHNRRGVRIYVDTCIVSGLAKGDLPLPEHRALAALLREHKVGNLRLATSPITDAELERIPEQHRIAHTAIYELLDPVPLHYSPGLLRPERAADDPHWWIYERLWWLLPDEADATHILFALRAGLHFFVTTDQRTILRFKKQLLADFDLRAMSPRGFLRYWRRSETQRHPIPPAI